MRKLVYSQGKAKKNLEKTKNEEAFEPNPCNVKR